MKLLTLWLSNEQSESYVKFNKENESAIIRIRFKGEMFQISHIILKGFNISKFSFDAGLMDDQNYEILKDNIFTKEVTYESNVKEKVFSISVKTLKDKQPTQANFCELTIHKIEGEDVLYGINSLQIYELPKTAVQEKSLTELNKMLSADSLENNTIDKENKHKLIGSSNLTKLFETGKVIGNGQKLNTSSTTKPV